MHHLNTCHIPSHNMLNFTGSWEKQSVWHYSPGNPCQKVLYRDKTLSSLGLGNTNKTKLGTGTRKYLTGCGLWHGEAEGCLIWALSVCSNGKCSACITGLLKEQILSLPALKKFKAFLEGEKVKVRESKVEEEIFQPAGPDCSVFRHRHGSATSFSFMPTYICNSPSTPQIHLLLHNPYCFCSCP